MGPRFSSANGLDLFAVRVVLLAAACAVAGCGGKIAATGSDAEPSQSTGKLEAGAGDAAASSVIPSLDDMSPCTSAAECIDPAAVCLPAGGSVHPVCCIPVGTAGPWESCCSFAASNGICACLLDGGAASGAPCTDNVDCCSGSCSALSINADWDGGTGLCF
jgi:hypothetical protein